MRVLNVAEKPSVAKTVSAILSNGNLSTVSAPCPLLFPDPALVSVVVHLTLSLLSCAQRPGLSRYNPIYDFRATVEGRACEMSFTSVTGHLLEVDFPPAFQSWEAVSVLSLFTAPLIQSVIKDKADLLHTLQREARHSDSLILWLDCDREGENIAFEVATTCQQVRPSLHILRARFSALIPADIHAALQSLGSPNRHLSDAVDARQEIDLRVGAAYTRFQTLLLRGVCPGMGSGVVSYGPCQFPTLGFVVAAWKRRMAFVRQRFWTVHMEWGGVGEAGLCRFTWARGRVFDQTACTLLYERMCESAEVRVVRVDAKERKRRRPLPLSTVELQKRLSSHARLSAARSMDVAEKLYQRGLISYPRTETDRYKEGTDMQQLLQNLTALPGDCGAYAQRLLTGGFVYPGDGGHDDQAHPPIHPTKADAGLTGDERVVYDFVVRHFLAGCSADAVGHETAVTAHCLPSGEAFTARGLMVVQRNYLDVYPYDRWYGNVIPVFATDQRLTGVRLSMSDGQTTPPPLLTESDLIACMDRHGIGTDATIAQHIDTIQKRKYVSVAQRTFVPTALGLGLVEGYEEMGLSLGEPALRAHMEGLMREVGEGKKRKEEVVAEVVRDMKALLESVQGRSAVLCEKVEEELMRGSTPEQRVLQLGLPLREEEEGPPDGSAAAQGGSGGSAPPAAAAGWGAEEAAGWRPQMRGDDAAGEGFGLVSDSSATGRRRKATTGRAEKRGGKTAVRAGRRGRSPPPPYPTSRAAVGGSHAGAAGAQVCYHCQEPGHFANQCPARARGQPAVGGVGGGGWSGGGGGGGQWGAAGGGGGGAADVECFRCHQKGHYANTCPSSLSR